MPRSRVYDEAVRAALTILWEAADRICGKRLREAIPTFVDAMERHGHLELEAEVRRRLVAMSAATMDRLLKPVRDAGRQGRRRSGISTALRRSIAVRTFNDWNDPPPGFLLNRIRQAQRDLVRHEQGAGEQATTGQELSRFVESLSTAWRNREVRPTHRKHSTGPRSWRTRADPFHSAWPMIEQWLNDQPDATAKELFQRLQAQMSEPFQPGQLRTWQRRVKDWRTAIARRLVLGADTEAGSVATPAEPHTSSEGSSAMPIEASTAE